MSYAHPISSDESDLMNNLMPPVAVASPTSKQMASAETIQNVMNALDCLKNSGLQVTGCLPKKRKSSEAGLPENGAPAVHRADNSGVVIKLAPTQSPTEEPNDLSPQSKGLQQIDLDINEYLDGTTSVGESEAVAEEQAQTQVVTATPMSSFDLKPGPGRVEKSRSSQPRPETTVEEYEEFLESHPHVDGNDLLPEDDQEMLDILGHITEKVGKDNFEYKYKRSEPLDIAEIRQELLSKPYHESVRVSMDLLERLPGSVLNALVWDKVFLGAETLRAMVASTLRMIRNESDPALKRNGHRKFLVSKGRALGAPGGYLIRQHKPAFASPLRHVTNASGLDEIEQEPSKLLPGLNRRQIRPTWFRTKVFQTSMSEEFRHTLRKSFTRANLQQNIFLQEGVWEACCRILMEESAAGHGKRYSTPSSSGPSTQQPPPQKKDNPS